MPWMIGSFVEDGSSPKSGKEGMYPCGRHRGRAPRVRSGTYVRYGGARGRTPVPTMPYQSCLCAHCGECNQLIMHASSASSPQLDRSVWRFYFFSPLMNSLPVPLVQSYTEMNFRKKKSYTEMFCLFSPGQGPGHVDHLIV